MSSAVIVDLCSDDELEDMILKPVKLEKAVKLEPDLVEGRLQQNGEHNAQLTQHQNLKFHFERPGSEENRCPNALSNGQSSTSILDQAQSPLDDTSLSSRSPICSAPICRQFWKAGNYDDGLASKATLQNGKNYLQIHPMFLHSNATSHKWAFGAIAELLDNAIDEIQNGATFVIVDKTTNLRDGSPALLIRDDGGGMGPEAMRHCMSFGFSDKKSKSAIGQYGNGFKTSSMRLGADVIVFSRHLDNRKLTQSIGLLSYTFLTRTGHDRIVVPMVDYEFNRLTSTFEPLCPFGNEHFASNLSVLLQWSPFSTEAELLKRFDEIGDHGTEVIIYNTWFTNEGKVELDFEMDPEDIRIGGDAKKIEARRRWIEVNEQHIANRFHYSLRVYLSILYLRIPQSFSIILRGRVVEHHNIANDLKYPEFILYRPQSGGCVEGTVVTTIGFLKEAPHVNIHGFNVYHKNRLILPFWQVVSYSDSRGRGVVGVLEANFVEPTHNKQDFERTSLFQKLEVRLKEMTWEYWDYHCGLLGYQVKKKPRPVASQQDSSYRTPDRGIHQPVILNKSFSAGGSVKAATASSLGGGLRKSRYSQGARTKRSEPEHGHSQQSERAKRQTVVGVNLTDTDHRWGMQLVNSAANQLEDPEAMNLIQLNKKFSAECLEYEKREKELELKAIRLRNEVGEVQREYDRMLAELKLLNEIKEENNVNM